MANTVKLHVITPSKLFYEGDIELVIVRTITGEEGFMAHHSWVCKLLDAGEMCIQEAGTKEFKAAAVSGGFIDVKDEIVIYADTAEWSFDIDVERADRIQHEVEKWLSEHKNEDTPELAEQKSVLAKEKARIKVAAGSVHKR